MSKKIFFTIIFLVIILVAGVALAQRQPTRCVKLGVDIKWTGSLPGAGVTQSAPPKECTHSQYKYCLFKKGNIIGETINQGDCGSMRPVNEGCNVVPWMSRSSYWEQQPQQDGNCLTSAWGMISLLNSVGIAVNWIFTILIVIAVLFVLFGAFKILTSGGSAEKINTGRSYILYAIIGLALALLSRAIPSVVSVLLGV